MHLHVVLLKFTFVANKIVVLFRLLWLGNEFHHSDTVELEVKHRGLSFVIEGVPKLPMCIPH